MSEPRLRKDAALNRQRLLAAGREVFAARGLDATLNDVARHAGVGVGTAYRRFENKEELIEAIFDQQVEELEQILHGALAEQRAWDGIVHYLERSIAIQTADRGLAQILSGRRTRPERHEWERDRLAPLVDRLVERAREQGAVRADVTGTDLIFLQIGIIAIAATMRDGTADVARTDVDTVYRRYLWLMLEGFRADDLPLPVAALSTDDTHHVLTQGHRQQE